MLLLEDLAVSSSVQKREWEARRELGFLMISAAIGILCQFSHPQFTSWDRHGLIFIMYLISLMEITGMEPSRGIMLILNSIHEKCLYH